MLKTLLEDPFIKIGGIADQQQLVTEQAMGRGTTARVSETDFSSLLLFVVPAGRPVVS